MERGAFGSRYVWVNSWRIDSTEHLHKELNTQLYNHELQGDKGENLRQHEADGE
jgi:hypothetical protein